MRKLRNKLDNVKPLITKIREGGTGAVSDSQALINLDAIPAALIDKADGVLSLDINKKLKSEVIAGLSITGISIDGPVSMTINQVQTFTITDYDSFLNYTLSAIGGSVSRSGDTITYTAPASAGPSGFIINGKTISVAVGASIVMAPTINNVINGANNIDQTISLTTTAFTVSSGSDTHQWTDWQIATDIAFTAIVTQSLSDTVHKTSWTSGTLQPNTTYYARVRYKGNSYGYSNWSSILTFTTKTAFLPNSETAKFSYTGESNARYGYSVAIDDSGTRLAIGVPFKTVSGNVNVGIVYILVKSGSSWVLESFLSPTTVTNAQCGYSVDIDSTGTRLVIGCGGKDICYVYLRTGTSWSLESSLTPLDTESFLKYFGRSVSIDNGGNRIVVGAYSSLSASGVRGGAVYVYLRTGTSWTQEAKIIANDYTAGNTFGWSVAIDDSGVRIIVGSTVKSLNSDPYGGGAYIYTRSGSSWAFESSLLPSITSSIKAMGYSVDIDSTGTRVVVGIPYYNSNQGAILVFLRTGTSWTQEVFLKEIASGAQSQYGYSVAITDSGDMISVGAILYNGNGYNKGGVFLHTRSGTTWDTKSPIYGAGALANEYFSWSVDISGQGNAIIVGAPYTSSILSGAGAVYVYA